MTRNITSVLAAALLILAAIVSTAIGDDSPRQKPSPEQIKRQRKEAAHRPRPIILNNDGNDSITAVNDPPLTHEKFLDQRTTALAGTQVAAIFYCTGVFNYYSHHSAETEPLKYVTEQYRDQGWDLGTRGPDTLSTIVAFGHKHGMEVFWSMRMNDTHDSYTPHLLCQWKKDHPERLLAKKKDKRIRSANGRWSAVNYAVPEVREKVFRNLADVATRYDVEGLELDFFRHPLYFQAQVFGQAVTQAERDMLTDLMRRVRKMADQRAVERGRPLLVAVRVPDSVDYCSAVGIDLVRWLQEDLVDLLVVGGYFQLNPWETSVALGHKYGVPVYPSLDDPRFKDKEAQDLRQSPACYRGRAMEAWAAGGDGIYLFNFFDPHSPLLKELGDPKCLTGMEQLYTVGTREERAAKAWLTGGLKFSTLPESLWERPLKLKPGETATVELRIGSSPQDRPVQEPPAGTVRLCFKETPSSGEAVTVKLNGRSFGPGTHDGRWIAYPLRREFLQKGVNRFELTLGEDSTRSLVLQDIILQMPAAADSASPIGAIRVGEPITIEESHGDTWVTAWARDGTLYSPSDDTFGFRRAGDANIAFNRLEGDDVRRLRGTTVSMMPDYGRSSQLGPDGCSWKSSGCYAIDGTLYWVVARHKYGETSGDAKRRQTAENASIIKSLDGGKTWTPSAKQNYEYPTFPGRRFAAPYFIEYGQDGTAATDNADRYVYAISNNGFWDNGDNLILGRVPRTKLAALDGRDWQFYRGGDGMADDAWIADREQAKLVIDAPGKLGMTGAAFIPALGRYLLVGWYYPAGGGKLKGASLRTVWDFYESPKPWGPWTKIGSKEWRPQGYYSPQVCPKFTSRDGRQLFLVTAGDWTNRRVYHLTFVPLQLDPPTQQLGE